MAQKGSKGFKIILARDSSDDEEETNNKSNSEKTLSSTTTKTVEKTVEKTIEKTKETTKETSTTNDNNVAPKKIKGLKIILADDHGDDDDDRQTGRMNRLEILKVIDPKTGKPMDLKKETEIRKNNPYYKNINSYQWNVDNAI